MVTKRKKSKDKVAIVGLGYVGLPLAILAAERGFRVTGIDKHARRVRALQRGVNILPEEKRVAEGIRKKIFTPTTTVEALRRADIIIICVPTPVDHLYKPDLKPVIVATQTIAKHLRRGQLIILESTVNPGVSEEIVLPILEKTGLKAGRDFDLAHCPERINPGDPVWHVGNIPRCVGATSTKGAKRAAAFYRSLISGEVRIMKSLKEAEATKIIENSFRDINIAFVNELARSFDALGIDLYDVIQGASTKPFAFMAHWPSIGVGGHCIPVDPYYLIERASQAGFDHKFLRLAREINNGMPEYAVSQLQLLLNQKKKAITGTTVGVLGLSYKANVGDIRESPALKVIVRLRDLGANVVTFDPFFPDQSTASSLEGVLKKSDAIILATNHRQFLTITGRLLARAGIVAIVDGKNCLSKVDIEKVGVLYKGIGR